MLLTRSETLLLLGALAPASLLLQDPPVRGEEPRPRQQPPIYAYPPAPAASAPGHLTALFTNLPASPTSDVPGIAGAKFTASATSTIIFDRPWLSPNGSHWAISADTDLAVAEDEVWLVDGVVAIREGTATLFDPTQTWGTLDTRIGINDLGELAITNNLAPSAIDDVTVKIAGAVQTVVTIEGGPIAALPGATWDDNGDSPVLLNDGRISISDDGIDGGGVTTNDDEIIVLDNILVAREGITIPGNQTGTPMAWENFSLEDTYFSTGGTHSLILGDLLGSATTDQVLVYDGNVVLQEGVVIPGSGMVSPIAGTAIRWVFMDSAGNWIARGENVDGVDWIVRNGVVVLTNGSQVSPVGETVLMTATIDQAQETPPSGSAATGTGRFLVNTSTNTLWYDITLTGVVGETMAHIHGFAPPGTPAGVLYALPVGDTKTGSITYLESEEQGILSGQTYVNIHTGAFPGGEIRGQILVSTELWTDGPSPLPTDTFFAVASNQVGDWVVMGTSNAPVDVNGILVLNGQHVIARENDPIDLDGNGLFDDDVFLNTFGNDDVVIADDGTVYFTASLRNGAGAQIGQGFLRRNGGNLQRAYCFGDGTGTACPCGNSSPVGAMAGCQSSLGVGGRLDSSGVASLSADTLALIGSQMPDSSVLYFQGTAQPGGGLGAMFGDGLRCVSGTVVRLKTLTNSGGMSQYPDAGSPSVSVRGMVLAPGVRNYQAWYRNAAAFCTVSTFNLTNGVQITWGG
jgi:hypothetical protein